MGSLYMEQGTTTGPGTVFITTQDLLRGDLGFTGIHGLDGDFLWDFAMDGSVGAFTLIEEPGGDQEGIIGDIDMVTDGDMHMEGALDIALGIELVVEMLRGMSIGTGQTMGWLGHAICPEHKLPEM